ncbi:hypothetical protein TNCV_3314301 [Trichonephila clavipes]|nr:hypothetical protein TNCV_3314301 [Trichonephila clavipes]
MRAQSGRSKAGQSGCSEEPSCSLHVRCTFLLEYLVLPDSNLLSWNRPLSGRSYSGQSGYSKNRDQKMREKISGGGNMGCGMKVSDFIGRARSSDNGV